MRRTLVTAILIGFALAPGADAQAPREPSPGARESGPADHDRRRRDIEEIMSLYYAGSHDAVVQKVDAYVAKHSATAEAATVFFFQAESRYRLGQLDEAIRAYESGIALIEPLNNVRQRRFVVAFFRLGTLHREQRRLDAAVARVEAGLRLEPQNIYYQVLLGELFREQGQRERALKHFRDLAASTLPTSEERAVLGIKIDRLTIGRPAASIQLPDLRDARLYPGFSIGILRLNEVPPEVILSDVCTVLESKWLVRCEVLDSLTVPESDILVVDRNQYDADRVLAELWRRLPASAHRHSYIVAVTGRDIFGPQTNFVFSWQVRTEDAGIGVISAHRFVTGLADFYERGIVATRRLAIQAISTTGSMLGFSRPTHPECPMAYPHDFREFQQKRSKLCESTVQQRDVLLQKRGGVPARFGEARSDEVVRVNRAYSLE